MSWSSSKNAWPVCDGNWYLPWKPGKQTYTYFQVVYLFIGLLQSSENQHNAASFSVVMQIYASWKCESPPPYVCTSTTGCVLLVFLFLTWVLFPTETVEASGMQLFQWGTRPARGEVLGCVGKWDAMTLSSQQTGWWQYCGLALSKWVFDQPRSKLARVWLGECLSWRPLDPVSLLCILLAFSPLPTDVFAPVRWNNRWNWGVFMVLLCSWQCWYRPV